MPVLESAKALSHRIGPRARDLVAIAASLLATLVSATGLGPTLPFPWPIALSAGLIATVALWWRRRWPVRTTLIGIAAVLLSGNPIPVIVGLFTTAVRRRDRTLAALSVASSLSMTVPELMAGDGFNVGPIISNAIVTALVVAAGSYVGARRDLLESLRERAERAEAEHDLRAEQAKAGERARIAREMHDVLAHKVSLIALHAGALEVNPDAGPARVEEVAGLIRTTARQTLEELRGVLGVLRSEDGPGTADLAPQAQAADIRRLVESSRQAGVQAELRSEVADLPDSTARAVYRVVQEGLTNVHKHARGAATIVTLSGNERIGVTVSITNQRPVASGSLMPGSGAGLVGLSERMRLIGGTLRSGPEPDGGWGLSAWLPWPDAPGQEADITRDELSSP